MKVIGLITEYNPFHNGHIYHINEARKKTNPDVTIAIMSGNFTQRGEVSIVDKFKRARAAINHVDLVVELPLLNAISYADDFALGGIRTAELLGVDEIVFGSESGDITSLNTLYKMSKDYESTPKFRQLLRKGYSHPRAIAELTHSEEISGSNNILGLSYIKAIDTLNSNMAASTIKRTGNQYNDKDLPNTQFASATSLRKSLLAEDFNAAKNYMPSSFVDTLETSSLITNEDFFDSLKLIITHKTPEELRKIYMMTEGLEYRLKKHIREATRYDEFIGEIKTKRYTWTRLNRLMMCILLNITKDKMAFYNVKHINHVRVLSMNKTGQKYLKMLPESLEVITNVNKENRDFISDEITALDVYNIASRSKNNDFNTPVFIQD